VGGVRVPAASDTRLLVAGLAAFLTLVIYLAVAFAGTHASAVQAPILTNKFAPWVPKYHSTLAFVSGVRSRGVEVRVVRGWVGDYGAVVPTLVAQPPPRHMVVVSLWLRASGRSPIEVLVDEFPAGPNPNLFDKTVPATTRWHRYTFSAPIKGTWLGLGMFVGRSTNGHTDKSFAVRGLTVELRRH
jgi:hypothetical protein